MTVVPQANKWHGAFALAACLLVGSCSNLAEALIGSEAPVENSESYLESAGGPQTNVDLGGSGGEQLLTRFQKLVDENFGLREAQEKMRAELEALRIKLESETADNETERMRRAGAEAEADRLRRIKGDREAKILHLQLQLTELQRSKLQLEIAAIERQLEVAELESAPATTPPSEGR